MQIDLSLLTEPTGDLLDFEMVERKGLGHPDTICDHLAEELSIGLSRHYLAKFGRVLHYNVDKALLWGGISRPAFGGGVVEKPMEIFLAGRATTSFHGQEIPLEEITSECVERWFASHLPIVDVKKHIVTHSLVRPGSSELAELFARHNGGELPLSNDTSCGLGYAPLSRLEAITFAVEQELGTLAKNGHPEIGRDIKVMGVRRGNHIGLTIACALVDRFIRGIGEYEAGKHLIAEAARGIAVSHGSEASVEVNAADDWASGNLYLTVLGTSAEAGDDGQAGRGNRVNGLITPLRPMTMESVAGKNAVTHVGKLYNIAAALIAQRIVEELQGVIECQCILVSTIGRSVTEPQLINIRVRLSPNFTLEQQRAGVACIVGDELQHLAVVGEELANGELRIGGWPLRSSMKSLKA